MNTDFTISIESDFTIFVGRSRDFLRNLEEFGNPPTLLPPTTKQTPPSLSYEQFLLKFLKIRKICVSD
jgi:hypothetical protein